MPKRSKKKVKEYSEEARDRPPALTLASFFTIAGVSNQETQTVVETGCEASVASTSTGASSTINTEEPTADRKTTRFLVSKTKKGKLPISYEKRAKGKRVTVVGNVSGNAEFLLHELKTRVGAGGVVRGDCVELQGDHQIAVGEFLTGHPWVK